MSRHFQTSRNIPSIGRVIPEIALEIFEENKNILHRKTNDRVQYMCYTLLIVTAKIYRQI